MAPEPGVPPFLLLRLAYPDHDIVAPPLIDGYWRHHGADAERFAADCRLLTRDTATMPAALCPPPTPTGGPPGDEVRDLYERVFPVGNAALWGWPAIDPGYRHGVPWLGPIHTRLPAAIDEQARTRLQAEALRQRAHAIGGSGATAPPKPHDAVTSAVPTQDGGDWPRPARCCTACTGRAPSCIAARNRCRQDRSGMPSARVTAELV